jgi:hypothetical protein
VNKEVWSQLPDFQYITPSVSSVLERNAVSLAALGLWLVLGIVAISNLKIKL